MKEANETVFIGTHDPMMDYFIGTKEIKARPMNRLDYNKYRGWELPSDEDGTDKGYLVEYLNGGQSNDERHKGYISWSPEAVFNNAYRKTVRISDFKSRLEDEIVELREKTKKLKDFLVTEKFESMDDIQGKLLTIQVASMRTYLQCIECRLELLESANEAKD